MLEFVERALEGLLLSQNQPPEILPWSHNLPDKVCGVIEALGNMGGSGPSPSPGVGSAQVSPLTAHWSASAL